MNDYACEVNHSNVCQPMRQAMTKWEALVLNPLYSMDNLNEWINALNFEVKSSSIE